MPGAGLTAGLEVRVWSGTSYEAQLSKEVKGGRAGSSSRDGGRPRSSRSSRDGGGGGFSWQERAGGGLDEGGGGGSGPAAALLETLVGRTCMHALARVHAHTKAT